ncbi:MAG: hypothetical protein GF317_05235 [Candidatus Lokiarchaeota archaeon]|nr:hypothetical protein [Candidatus Lokiarchaeota archaeon]MBD3199210.1 hypothetical protein [Candidatus Lokiarchaeota archaeon]
MIFISIPATLREGPRTTNTLAKKKYLIVYFLLIILGAQPSIIWFWFYWQLFRHESFIFYTLFPLALIICIILLIYGSAFIAKIFLMLTNKIHKPKEGVFSRNKNDKDYCYWSLRSVIRKWPVWLARQLSIPAIERSMLRLFGVSIGKNCALHEGWVDCEFIEIANNFKLGQGSIISSSLQIQDKLILKKIVIKSNVTVGIHSIILPGTTMENNSVLDANSTSAIGMTLDSNRVYRGAPARKVLDTEKLEQELSFYKDLIFTNYEINSLKEEDLQEKSKELAIPFHLYIASGWLIIGFSFIIPGFLFFLYVFGVLEPNLLNIPLNFSNIFSFERILHLILVPVIFVSIYLLHLFFVALFTRWFYRFADKRGPNEGVFDRNLNKESKILDYYHFRSFLFKYPIYVFTRSPFPWLINWELRFLGSNKIGKGTVIEESFLHSHIDFGRNNYLGTYTHITNHLVDGVYGKENLTFYGPKLGDNVIFESLTGALPGTEVNDNSTFLPIGSTVKLDKLNGDAIYSGFPARKLNEKEIIKLLGERIQDEK